MSTQIVCHSVGRAKSSGALKRFFAPDNRYLAPILTTCILLAGHLSTTGELSENRAGNCHEHCRRVSSGMAADAQVASSRERIHYRHQRGYPGSLPAYWPYVVCSLLSISSKYVLRLKNRHIWNPSNLESPCSFSLRRRRLAFSGETMSGRCWSSGSSAR